MWVIVLHKNIEDQRNNRILELIGEVQPSNQYLSNRFSQYSVSYGISKFTLFFKKESGALKIVNEFNNYKKESINNDRFNKTRKKFIWILDNKLSIRKLTLEEWNSYIDLELNRLSKKYELSKDKLLKKKYSYS